MKKTTFYVIIFLTTILLASCFSSCDGILGRNKKPLASAYAHFQEINEKYRSENFEVKLFCETQALSSASPHPIRVFPSVNNHLIVSCDAEKNEKTQGDQIYYKINSDGARVDTLYLPQDEYSPEFIDDFMVFTNYDEAYYTTWPQNGDTTKQAIKVLNEDLNWAEEKVNQKIENAKKDGKYWFFKNVTNNDNYYMQFFFYQDRQWQMLWQKLPAYRSLDRSETADRYCIDVFWTGEEDFDLPDNVNFLHFHPEEKLSYDHHIGGGNPGYSVTNWRGKAFFKTQIGGKDFNFFAPNIVVENEKFDDFKNRFYKVRDRDSGAIIFRPSFYISANGFAFYSSDSQKMYLIRKKNNQ
ncbi:hypothetical protein LZQ00_12260 [Sphingobacterium sp. SRCM116780]|uniref:hypothetical protein n=1 Tax=Sphingobacterium sp. SRCM116780 TaxID=2907623 RepID=UPI001F3F0D57|nr:hypothetical protein [Sphingobacterium sp. SRCM116780]UIR55052.1 hypothetical protein LZQ00_12260 [Sphingobacterium sp. SRCM116780]